VPASIASPIHSPFYRRDGVRIFIFCGLLGLPMRFLSGRETKSCDLAQSGFQEVLTVPLGAEST
jgi:hypothetical protein